MLFEEVYTWVLQDNMLSQPNAISHEDHGSDDKQWLVLLGLFNISFSNISCSPSTPLSSPPHSCHNTTLNLSSPTTPLEHHYMSYWSTTSYQSASSFPPIWLLPCDITTSPHGFPFRNTPHIVVVLWPIHLHPSLLDSSQTIPINSTLIRNVHVYLAS